MIITLTWQGKTFEAEDHALILVCRPPLQMNTQLHVRKLNDAIVHDQWGK